MPSCLSPGLPGLVVKLMGLLGLSLRPAVRVPLMGVQAALQQSAGAQWLLAHTDICCPLQAGLHPQHMPGTSATVTAASSSGAGRTVDSIGSGVRNMAIADSYNGRPEQQPVHPAARMMQQQQHNSMVRSNSFQ